MLWVFSVIVLLVAILLARLLRPVPEPTVLTLVTMTPALVMDTPRPATPTLTPIITERLPGRTPTASPAPSESRTPTPTVTPTPSAPAVQRG